MVKIIGIQGISGSGKTFLTKYLALALQATCLHWDDYDSISSDPPDYTEWLKTSKDYNDWKYDALGETLCLLKHGQTVTCPATQRTLIPTEYVIFDAPLGYDHKITGQWIDFLIFLDTPPDVALARRLLRDYQPQSKRNDNEILDEISDYLYARPVYMETYERKNRADLILDGSQSIDLLVSEVLTSLKCKAVLH